MGFFFTLVYIALSLLRPAELFLWLGRYHVMDVAAGLALVATAASVIGGRGPSLRSPQLYLILAFVAWAGFSVYAAQRWLGGAMGALQSLATSAFLFLLITLNVDSLARLRATQRLLVFMALYLVIQGGAAYFFHVQEAAFVVTQKNLDEEAVSEEDAEERADDQRPARDAPGESGEDGTGGDPAPGIRRIRGLGFLNDPNDLAQALAATLPLLLLEWRPRRPLRNVFVVCVPAAILLGGIVLTRSRGGLVALGAMILAAAILFGSRLVSTVSMAAAVGAVLGGLALMRTYVRLDESSFGRVAAWSEGLQMIKHSPVWGVGYGGFTDYNTLVAHNSFIHCFAELGIVGYFFWLGVVVVTLHDLFVLGARGPRRTESVDAGMETELRHGAAATGLSLIGFLAGAFFLSRAYSTTLFIFLALPTALADVARRAGHRVAPFVPLAWGAGIFALQIATVVAIYGIVRLVH